MDLKELSGEVGRPVEELEPSPRAEGKTSSKDDDGKSSPKDDGKSESTPTHTIKVEDTTTGRENTPGTTASASAVSPGRNTLAEQNTLTAQRLGELPNTLETPSGALDRVSLAVTNASLEDAPCSGVKSTSVKQEELEDHVPAPDMRKLADELVMQSKSSKESIHKSTDRVEWDQKESSEPTGESRLKDSKSASPRSQSPKSGFVGQPTPKSGSVGQTSSPKSGSVGQSDSPVSDARSRKGSKERKESFTTDRKESNDQKDCQKDSTPEAKYPDVIDALFSEKPKSESKADSNSPDAKADSQCENFQNSDSKSERAVMDEGDVALESKLEEAAVTKKTAAGTPSPQSSRKPSPTVSEQPPDPLQSPDQKAEHQKAEPLLAAVSAKDRTQSEELKQKAEDRTKERLEELEERSDDAPQNDESEEDGTPKSRRWRATSRSSSEGKRERRVSAEQRDDSRSQEDSRLREGGARVSDESAYTAGDRRDGDQDVTSKSRGSVTWADNLEKEEGCRPNKEEKRGDKDREKESRVEKESREREGREKERDREPRERDSAREKDHGDKEPRDKDRDGRDKDRDEDERRREREKEDREPRREKDDRDDKRDRDHSRRGRDRDGDDKGDRDRDGERDRGGEKSTKDTPKQEASTKDFRRDDKSKLRRDDSDELEKTRGRKEDDQDRKTKTATAERKTKENVKRKRQAERDAKRNRDAADSPVLRPRASTTSKSGLKKDARKVDREEERRKKRKSVPEGESSSAATSPEAPTRKPDTSRRKRASKSRSNDEEDSENRRKQAKKKEDGTRRTVIPSKRYTEGSKRERLSTQSASISRPPRDVVREPERRRSQPAKDESSESDPQVNNRAKIAKQDESTDSDANYDDRDRRSEGHHSEDRRSEDRRTADSRSESGDSDHRSYRSDTDNAESYTEEEEGEFYSDEEEDDFDSNDEEDDNVAQDGDEIEREVRRESTSKPERETSARSERAPPTAQRARSRQIAEGEDPPSRSDSKGRSEPSLTSSRTRDHQVDEEPANEDSSDYSDHPDVDRKSDLSRTSSDNTDKDEKRRKDDRDRDDRERERKSNVKREKKEHIERKKTEIARKEKDRTEKEREKERDRTEKERDKDRNRAEKEKDSHRDREKDRDKDRDRTEKERDKERDRGDKDREKDRDRAEKDTRDRSEKERDRGDKDRDRTDKDKERPEKDRDRAEKDRDRSEKERDKDRDRGDKERERPDKDRDRSDKDRDRVDKDRDRSDKDRDRVDKDRDRGDKDRDRGDKDRDRVDKDRDRGDKDRDRGEKDRDHKDRDRDFDRDFERGDKTSRKVHKDDLPKTSASASVKSRKEEEYAREIREKAVSFSKVKGQVAKPGTTLRQEKLQKKMKEKETRISDISSEGDSLSSSPLPTVSEGEDEDEDRAQRTEKDREPELKQRTEKMEQRRQKRFQREEDRRRRIAEESRKRGNAAARVTTSRGKSGRGSGEGKTGGVSSRSVPSAPAPPKNQDADEGDEDEDEGRDPAGTAPLGRGRSLTIEDAEDLVVEASPKGRFARFNRKLGAGSYKQVYLGFDYDTGREVAWNVIAFQQMTPHEKKRIQDEINITKSLTHDRILKYINAWRNKVREEVIFITERVTGGSLRQYVNRLNAPLKIKVVRNWGKQILEGLHYLHNHDPNPIIHRDLKCDNIFINGNIGEVLIGDLGLSAMLHSSMRQNQSVVGTPEFMAPELYEEKYGTSVDIYAFGMCLIEMVSRAFPFAECHNTVQVYNKVMKGEQPRVVKRIRDPVLRGLIQSCIQRDADSRPTAATLLEHPFLNSEEGGDDICDLLPCDDGDSTEEDPHAFPITQPEIREDEAASTASPDDGRYNPQEPVASMQAPGTSGSAQPQQQYPGVASGGQQRVVGSSGTQHASVATASAPSPRNQQQGQSGNVFQSDSTPRGVAPASGASSTSYAAQKLVTPPPQKEPDYDGTSPLPEQVVIGGTDAAGARKDSDPITHTDPQSKEGDARARESAIPSTTMPTLGSESRRASGTGLDKQIKQSPEDSQDSSRSQHATTDVGGVYLSELTFTVSNPDGSSFKIAFDYDHELDTPEGIAKELVESGTINSTNDVQHLANIVREALHMQTRNQWHPTLDLSSSRESPLDGSTGNSIENMLGNASYTNMMANNLMANSMYNPALNAFPNLFPYSPPYHPLQPPSTKPGFHGIGMPDRMPDFHVPPGSGGMQNMPGSMQNMGMPDRMQDVGTQNMGMPGGMPTYSTQRTISPLNIPQQGMPPSGMPMPSSSPQLTPGMAPGIPHIPLSHGESALTRDSLSTLHPTLTNATNTSYETPNWACWPQQQTFSSTAVWPNQPSFLQAGIASTIGPGIASTIGRLDPPAGYASTPLGQDGTEQNDLSSRQGPGRQGVDTDEDSTQKDEAGNAINSQTMPAKSAVATDTLTNDNRRTTNSYYRGVQSRVGVDGLFEEDPSSPNTPNSQNQSHQDQSTSEHHAPPNDHKTIAPSEHIGHSELENEGPGAPKGRQGTNARPPSVPPITFKEPTLTELLQMTLFKNKQDPKRNEMILQKYLEQPSKAVTVGSNNPFIPSALMSRAAAITNARKEQREQEKVAAQLEKEKQMQQQAKKRAAQPSKDMMKTSSLSSIATIPMKTGPPDSLGDVGSQHTNTLARQDSPSSLKSSAHSETINYDAQDAKQADDDVVVIQDLEIVVGPDSEIIREINSRYSSKVGLSSELGVDQVADTVFQQDMDGVVTTRGAINAANEGVPPSEDGEALSQSLTVESFKSEGLPTKMLGTRPPVSEGERSNCSQNEGEVAADRSPTSIAPPSVATPTATVDETRSNNNQATQDNEVAHLGQPSGDMPSSTSNEMVAANGDMSSAEVTPAGTGSNSLGPGGVSMTIPTIPTRDDVSISVCRELVASDMIDKSQDHPQMSDVTHQSDSVGQMPPLSELPIPPLSEVPIPALGELPIAQIGELPTAHHMANQVAYPPLAGALTLPLPRITDSDGRMSASYTLAMPSSAAIIDGSNLRKQSSRAGSQGSRGRSPVLDSERDAFSTDITPIAQQSSAGAGANVLEDVSQDLSQIGDLSSIDVPSIEAPSIDVPSIDVPSIDVPSKDVSQLDIPVQDAAQLAVPDKRDSASLGSVVVSEASRESPIHIATAVLNQVGANTVQKVQKMGSDRKENGN